MTLTDKDIGTLDRAAELKRRFDAGIFPRTSGDWSHFRKLARLGLLTLTGSGRDIDGEVERDVWIFELTDEGRATIDSWHAAEKRRG